MCLICKELEASCVRRKTKTYLESLTVLVCFVPKSASERPKPSAGIARGCHGQGCPGLSL
jgi:hypothetical protein